MPNDEEKMTYIKYEAGWKAQACPECQRTATSHGFLSWEPRSQQAFAHVFLHEKGDDCLVAGSKYLTT
jgi:hypothetical protein